MAEGIENISEDLLDSDDGLLFSFKLIKAVVYLFIHLYIFIFIYLFIYLSAIFMQAGPVQLQAGLNGGLLKTKNKIFLEI